MANIKKKNDLAIERTTLIKIKLSIGVSTFPASRKYTIK